MALNMFLLGLFFSCDWGTHRQMSEESFTVTLLHPRIEDKKEQGVEERRVSAVLPLQ